MMGLWELKVEAREDPYAGLQDALYEICSLCDGMCLKHSVEDVCPGVLKCTGCGGYSSDLSLDDCPCCGAPMQFLWEVCDVESVELP